MDYVNCEDIACVRVKSTFGVYNMEVDYICNDSKGVSEIISLFGICTQVVSATSSHDNLLLLFFSKPIGNGYFFSTFCLTLMNNNQHF
jgi:hypothetical protein